MPGHVRQQADPADGRCWQDALAVGLVVERDIAGHDREIEGAAGLANALDAAHELAHGMRALGIAEVQVVGDGERRGADGGQVAPGLGHGLPAALDRIRLAIARRDIARHGEALGAVLDADDAGIAAGRDHGIAENQGVVLFIDPALRALVRRADQLQQRLAVGQGRRDRAGGDHRQLWRVHPGPVIFGSLVAEFLDRHVGHDLALMADHEPERVGGVADHGEVETPLAEDGLRLGFLAGREHHQHALLAFRQHHLVGAHALFAAGHLVEIELDAQIALRAHLHGRAGQPRRAHVLDGVNAALGHDFEAGFQ